MPIYVVSSYEHRLCLYVVSSYEHRQCLYVVSSYEHRLCLYVVIFILYINVMLYRSRSFTRIQIKLLA